MTVSYVSMRLFLNELFFNLFIYNCIKAHSFIHLFFLTRLDVDQTTYTLSYHKLLNMKFNHCISLK